MFTGLVEALGTVRDVQPQQNGSLLVINAAFANELTIGESVAINGACLTVIAHVTTTCHFQAGPETLRRTNLGELQAGDRVNLERSLRIGDRLGGHIVQGHIDGVGSIEQRLELGEWVTIWFRCSEHLATLMVSKGSIAVDGVSLTLVEVERERFSVALIPHTLAMTTLGFKKPGDSVNLETDLFAKYVQKVMKSMTGART